MIKQLAVYGIWVAVLCGSLSASASSNEQWVEVRSSHFTVITDSNEKQARHLVDQFERMRWVFHSLFPKADVDPMNPIVVMALKNEKSFQSVEPEAYLAKGAMHLAGYFQTTADKNYVLLRLDAEGEHPYATVYHEYTHLQFASAAEWMPLWMNEGLAEFFQNTEIHDKDARVGQASVNDILYLRQNRLIPLTTLLKVDASSPYYHEEQKGSVFYAESWALTHYLEISDREKGTHRITDYLTLMSQHEDSVTAAEKAFGDLKRLQMALETYIRESAYKEFLLSSAAARLDESSYVVRNLKTTDADAVRADVLANLGRTKDARALLDEVRKADPNNVQADETMGLLEFRGGNPEAARGWYEQAVKLDSKSYLAQYYFAAMSMWEGLGRPGDEERSAPIEASLRAAIQLNPRFAPAYDRLASFYGMRHKNLEEAHLLNVQAIGLDPSNFNYRMNAANVLITMDRTADALAVMALARKVAKNPGEVAIADTRMAELRQRTEQRAQEAAAEKDRAASGNAVATQVVVVASSKPKHPTEAAAGPKHSVVGVIRGVVCSYPSVIEFGVERSAKDGGKTAALYNNDFTKIEFTVVGFTPEKDLNPCHDMEGMKAMVKYAESSDKTVDGQVTAVELRK